jgi:hypothetical protein
MRKLIVAGIMSLDGYVDGPGGNVMVLPMDGFFDELPRVGRRCRAHAAASFVRSQLVSLAGVAPSGRRCRGSGRWPCCAATPTHREQLWSGSGRPGGQRREDRQQHRRRCH